MQADYSTYDDALKLLSPFSDTLKNSLTSHAPMVADALCAMGRPEAVVPWVQRYSENMQPKPAPTSPVDPADFTPALGQYDRSSDWRVFFEAQIAALGWQAVLGQWADMLAPGLCGAAAHGIIRTAHAVRALEGEENSLRRAELAEGLALWAASHQTLPTDDTARVPAYADPVAALGQVAVLPDDARENNGSIVMALFQLDKAPDFGQAIHRYDVGDDVGAAADRLAIGLGHLFRAQADSFLYGIVFCHTITATAAILKLVPYLDGPAAKRMLQYGWQTGCGLYAAYAKSPAPNPYPDLVAETENAIIAAAVAHGDDHVIKLAETCLMFYARTNDDVFLTVPAHMRSIAA